MADPLGSLSSLILGEDPKAYTARRGDFSDLAGVPGRAAKGGLQVGAMFGPYGDVLDWKSNPLAVGSLIATGIGMGWIASKVLRGDINLPGRPNPATVALDSQYSRLLRKRMQAESLRQQPLVDTELKAVRTKIAENVQTGEEFVQYTPTPRPVSTRAVTDTGEPSRLLEQDQFNPDTLFGGLSKRRARLLSISAYGDDDLGNVASAVRKNLFGVAGWPATNSWWKPMMALSKRLMTEVPENASTTEPIGALRLAFAHLDTLVDPDTAPRLVGKKGKKLAKLFPKVFGDDPVTEAELAEFSDLVVQLEKQLAVVPHPELEIDPVTAVKSVDLDSGRTTLRFAPFEVMSMERMSEFEMNRRIKEMISISPHRMAELMSDNIVDFVQPRDAGGWLRPGSVRRFRKWYPLARRQVIQQAAERSVDPKKAIAIAAALSASEPWETNIAKALDLLEVVNAKIAKSGGTVDWKKLFPAVEREMKKRGRMVSGNDLVKTVVLALAPEIDVKTIFDTGVRSGGLSYSRIRAGLESGELTVEDALLRRNIGAPYNAQKQPAFARSIDESGGDTDIVRNLLLGKLMIEGFDKVEARQELPVVVDRHAFRIAIGMTGKPDTWLSSSKEGYDSIAHAYRLAAARLGEFDDWDFDDAGVLRKVGTRRLTPEELQAITWAESRRITGVRAPVPVGSLNNVAFDENGRPIGRIAELDEEVTSAEMIRRISDSTTPETGRRVKAALNDRRTPGWNVKGAGIANWSQGSGPDVVFNDRLIPWVTGEAAGTIPYHLADDAKIDITDTEYRVEFLPKQKLDQEGEIYVHLQDDGSVVVSAQPDRIPVGMVAAPVRLPDGTQAIYRMEPAPVADIDEFARHILDKDRAYDIRRPRRVPSAGFTVMDEPPPDDLLNSGRPYVRVSAPVTDQGGGENLAGLIVEWMQDSGKGLVKVHGPADVVDAVGPQWAGQVVKPHRGMTIVRIDPDGNPHWSKPAGVTDTEYLSWEVAEDVERRFNTWVEFDTPESAVDFIRWLYSPSRGKFGAAWLDAAVKHNKTFNVELADIVSTARSRWERMNRFGTFIDYNVPSERVVAKYDAVNKRLYEYQKTIFDSLGLERVDTEAKNLDELVKMVESGKVPRLVRGYNPEDYLRGSNYYLYNLFGLYQYATTYRKGPEFDNFIDELLGRRGAFPDSGSTPKYEKFDETVNTAEIQKAFSERSGFQLPYDHDTLSDMFERDIIMSLYISALPDDLLRSIEVPFRSAAVDLSSNMMDAERILAGEKDTLWTRGGSRGITYQSSKIIGIPGYERFGKNEQLDRVVAELFLDKIHRFGTNSGRTLYSGLYIPKEAFDSFKPNAEVPMPLFATSWQRSISEQIFDLKRHSTFEGKEFVPVMIKITGDKRVGFYSVDEGEQLTNGKFIVESIEHMPGITEDAARYEVRLRQLGVFDKDGKFVPLEECPTTSTVKDALEKRALLIRNERSFNIDQLDEQVPDVSAQLPAGYEPGVPNAKLVWSHWFQDPKGRTLMHLTEAGSPETPNNTRTWVIDGRPIGRDDLYNTYVKDVRLTATTPGWRQVEWGDGDLIGYRWVAEYSDRDAVVVDNPAAGASGVKFKSGKRREPADEVWVEAVPGKLPRIRFGHSTIAPATSDGLDPAHSVHVTISKKRVAMSQKNKNSKDGLYERTVLTVEHDGDIDVPTYGRVVDTLRSAGFDTSFLVHKGQKMQPRRVVG